MPYTRKLPAPITLDDGRVLTTLADVVRLMETLPSLHLSNHHWQYAAEAIMKAAGEGSTKADLDEAERLIRLGLYWERLLRN
jgi:hypothetical protein